MRALFILSFLLTKFGTRYARAGCVLQMYALMKAEEKSTQAIASILISAATTGLASSTVSFDWDVDPVKRKETPDFYGYIPDGASRTAIFACMTLNSALQLLSRSFCAAILMLVEKKYFFWYAAGDMALYFLQKVLRGDFWYWMPVGGKAEFAVSIIGRVVGKIITDFTSLVHFRHPNEVGGAYWIFGFAMTMGSLPVATVVAEPHVAERGTDLAWTVVRYLIPFTIVCFAVFFLNIKREYWHTFWSTKRGKDLTMAF